MEERGRVEIGGYKYGGGGHSLQQLDGECACLVNRSPPSPLWPHTALHLERGLRQGRRLYPGVQSHALHPASGRHPQPRRLVLGP